MTKESNRYINVEIIVDKYLNFLSGVTRRRLRNCLQIGDSGLLYFLSDRFYDEAEDSYIGVYPNRYAPSKNHEFIRGLERKGLSPHQYGDAEAMLFCNPLAIPEILGWKDGKPQYGPRPMQRIVNAGVFVQTVEYDPPEDEAKIVRDFLQTQIGWCIGGKKDTDCIVGHIYKDMCKYRDFRGLEVVWSGSKSCHLHFAFDTRHLAATHFGIRDTTLPEGDFLDVPDDILRPGFIDAWSQLPEIVKYHTGVEFEPDDLLARPEQYRRLPYGLRKIDKENVLGIPIDTVVPQAVLWKKFRSYSRPTEDDPWFHRPSRFFETARSRENKRKSCSRRPTSTLPPEQETAFIAELASLCSRTWGDPHDHPRPATVTQSGDGDYSIYFHNNNTDKNPSSVMVGNHDKLLVMSRDPSLQERKYSLPLSGNELVECYLEEGHLLITSNPARKMNLLERRFRETEKEQHKSFSMPINTPGDIRKHLPSYISLAARSNRLTAILSQEGAGKSTACIGLLPDQDEIFDGLLFVSCLSYEQAEEKCDEFNAKNTDSSYLGLVLRSFSNVYKEIVGDDSFLSDRDVSAMGCSNRLNAVYQMGGEVVEELEAYKAEFWDALKIVTPSKLKLPSGKKAQRMRRPVIFTVDGVIQSWHHRGGTRMWLHRDFHLLVKARKRNDPKATEIEKRIYNHLAAQWIIYDEVRTDDLMHRHPKDQVDWCHQLLAQHAGWRKLYLKDRLKAYDGMIASDPMKEMNFALCEEILSIGYKQTDLRRPDPSVEPFGLNNAENGPYLRVKDKEYYTKTKDWWLHNPCRITMLTTEHRVFAALNSIRDYDYQTRASTKAPNEETHAGTEETHSRPDTFELFDFDRPDVFDDQQVSLELYFDRMVRSKRKERNGKKDIQLLAESILRRWPGSQVISNVARGANITTHDTAKGSNSFKGAPAVIALYTPISPAQYESLLLENAHFGINNAVQLFYLDQFNQTCGRTLGFRYDQGTETKAVISEFLWKQIGVPLLSGSRYRIHCEGDLESFLTEDMEPGIAA